MFPVFNILAQRLHQLKFSKFLLIKLNNSSVPSSSSSQILICVSLSYLPSPLLAILCYYFMSTHQKKMILVNRISGVKLSTVACWQFASVESKAAPSSCQLPEKLQDFVFHIPIADPFPVSFSHTRTELNAQTKRVISQIFPLRLKHFICTMLHAKIKGYVIILC